MIDWAEDLHTLAWLHAAERAPEAWLSLHAAGFPAGLVAVGDECRAAMERALCALRQRHRADPGAADAVLAADYADIYLTHALQASPYESVWRDDDHLMLQGPTFAVRAFYRRHGLHAPDWRRMPDDHVSHELSFVARLLEQDERAEALRFLEQHLLVWLPRFVGRVAERAATEVYAALAALTLDACRALRQRLAAEVHEVEGVS